MMPKPRRSRAFRLIVSIVIIYLMGATVLYFFQEKFLFHPQAVDRNQPYAFEQPFEETEIPFSSTDTLNMIRFFAGMNLTRRGLVLYFHGNQKNVARYAQFAKNFTRNGYEVWMPDYPGFGKSTGVLTENKMYRLAEQLHALALQRFRPDSIVVYGKSLGTGTAAYLASVKPVKALLLETPYCSIPDLLSHFAPVYPCRMLSKYSFPVRDFLSEMNCPVVLFHGTSDGVVPYGQSLRLISVLKANDRLITIEGGSHNDLNDFPIYQHALDSILAN